MRPVNKGQKPVEYKHYRDAEPYLEQRLGTYCSFCEMDISNAPEVEHKEAKSRGGQELEWDNLLLSCKYCNTRKGIYVKKGDKEKYIWPDKDDTFHAYLYDEDLPRLNEEYLKTKDINEREKAENLFNFLKLDNYPVTPKDRDKRFAKRNEARNYAISGREGLKSIKGVDERRVYLELMINLAKSSGFFSVWMEVFKDDDEIKNMLISIYPGTRTEYVSN